MANQEQLDVLRRGAKVWGQWRSKNFHVNVDLSDADLSDANLSNANLSNANLSNADLSDANLSDANLSNANLRYADLSDASLSDANLSDANLSDANLSDANLSNANLSNANLSNADLSDANLSDANLSDANLIYADLSNADLRYADLSNANLSGANLRDVILNEQTQIGSKWRLVHDLVNGGAGAESFRGADLSNANFSGADLSGADLRHADLSNANLSGADLSNANLSGADLRYVNLSSADLSYINLSSSDLSSSDLSNANLSNANLSGANLSGANLSDAYLVATQLLATDLVGAKFTRVCIENWNINSETKLNDVICEYVYLKRNQQERRPSNGNFKLGEFTLLFQKALATVDLIFADGIDWQAFFQSFQELRSQYDDLSIQAIEKKSGGAFVIRLEVPPEADKAAIESHAKELYELQLQLLETQYRAELHAKDREIEIYKQKSADMLEIVKLQASRPINPIAIAGSQAMGDRNIHLGSGNYNERIEGNYVQGNYINMSQDLTQAAQQIQDLLQQLQNQGIPVETAQQQVATNMAKQAETDPAMMGKLVLWGKAMANKASETTVSEAAKIVFTLALKAAGLA